METTAPVIDRETTDGSGTSPTRAHIVWPRADFEAAMAAGTSVTALCGHTWKPTLVEPGHLPVCSDCRAVMAQREGRVR